MALRTNFCKSSGLRFRVLHSPGWVANAKVHAACLARQVGFTEIDLRWGVTEEESKNGATVEISLKEIDHCRDFPPFFIGFLGERYLSIDASLIPVAVRFKE